MVADMLCRSTTQVCAKAHKLGIGKTAAYLASEAAGRLRHGNKACAEFRFRKGMTPWNKGAKGSTGTHPHCKAHHFEHGNKPQTTVPIGTRRVTKDGILEAKMTDTPGVYYLRWRPVHRMVWEAVHGPVPAGHVVVFKPGMKTTDEARITPDAIECIRRDELMRRNSVHTRYPELAPAYQALAALTRQINAKKKANHA
jgi:hypothetical protein